MAVPVAIQKAGTIPGGGGCWYTIKKIFEKQRTPLAVQEVGELSQLKVNARASLGR
jgi:hypothetical protein